MKKSIPGREKRGGSGRGFLACVLAHRTTLSASPTAHLFTIHYQRNVANYNKFMQAFREEAGVLKKFRKL
jgi:hypothetical protein